MIYSASRRTDLPAFYPEFIVARIRRARKLRALVFWTKDPRNLVAHPELAAVARDWPCLVQLTLTGLAGSAWEPNVPRPELLSDALTRLGRDLPAGAVIWRFDPIIDTPDLFERFARTHELLRATLGPLREVVVSFADPYRKVMRRLARLGLRLPLPDHERRVRIIRELRRVSGLELRLCCEPRLLRLAGTSPATCIDAARLDRLYGTSLGGLPKDRGQRAACTCARSTDIGSYQQPCAHQCRYCYAWNA